MNKPANYVPRFRSHRLTFKTKLAILRAVSAHSEKDPPDAAPEDAICQYAPGWNDRRIMLEFNIAHPEITVTLDHVEHVRLADIGRLPPSVNSGAGRGYAIYRPELDEHLRLIDALSARVAVLEELLINHKEAV
jgi:hypothetical protein